MRGGALDRARCFTTMLAVNDDGVDAFRDRDSLIPFDPENGTMFPRVTLRILDSLDLPKADREKIDYKNLEAVTGVKLVK